ncbi:MAG: 50S ribosomal protein L11 methyltransferase [Flavobacteriales bacterium]|nr:MAG: 50S ribosomal protein L11 methyltransferase [Flavobacteriales bacterium]
MSDTVYIEVHFKVDPPQPASDILIAELGEAGFESFVEQEDGILAYIQKEAWSNDILNAIQILSSPLFKIQHHFREIEQQNWNATWEQHFEAIQINDQCVVRAPFHDAPNVPYDIVIMPKMSFGTGHHETTHMMLQHILNHDFKQKGVLDMGSGTGVLAILAEMRGADRVDAVDNDHWCYLNALENVERNGCRNISVHEDDVHFLKDQRYDVILANINRNILLADIPAYTRALKKKGLLFVSGFYRADLDLISEKCGEAGLVYQEQLERNDWVSVKYLKSS